MLHLEFLSGAAELAAEPLLLVFRARLPLLGDDTTVMRSDVLLQDACVIPWMNRSSLQAFLNDIDQHDTLADVLQITLRINVCIKKPV